MRIVYVESEDDLYLPRKRPDVRVGLRLAEQELFISPRDEGGLCITWKIGLLYKDTLNRVLDKVAPTAIYMLNKGLLPTKRTEIYLCVVADLRAHQQDEVPWVFAQDYFGENLDWAIQDLSRNGLGSREIANRLFALFRSNRPYIYGIEDYVRRIV